MCMCQSAHQHVDFNSIKKKNHGVLTQKDRALSAACYSSSVTVILTKKVI